MGTLGIGVDVVHIPRILALIRRRGPELLARRILSQQEIDEWRVFPPSDVAVQAKFLAVRWSLKEAGYKALYPIARPTWKDFTISRVNGKKPVMRYNATDSASLMEAKFHCSVSHDGEYIFSTVLVEDADK